MLEHTKGILLHRLKYSDSRIILKIFTEKFGLQSYMFFVSSSKKGKSLLNILQPMYILDLRVYHKEKNVMHKIKDVSADILLTSLPFDVYKQSITIFLSEFVLKILQENEPDEKMFKFIAESINVLDKTELSVSDFHLFFLVRMCRFAGISPENNYSDFRKIFNLRTGKFMTGHPDHKYFLNETDSFNLHRLLKSPESEIKLGGIKKNERNSLLSGLVDFYNIHLDKPGKLKSPEILSRIFS